MGRIIMENKILMIFLQYFPDATKVKIKRISYGHIHDTYLVENEPKFIIQKINRYIFQDVPALMHNIALISSWLQANKSTYPLEIPVLQYTLSGKPYVEDKNGDFWRVSSYIENNNVYQKPISADNAKEGGKALGIFSRTVTALDPSPFNIILPNFHNIHLRWDEYQKALNQAAPERFSETSSDLLTADTYYPMMLEFNNELTSGDIPIRITHNDTKFNNFLFDKKDKALSIIDLDTIMPGYTLYDFGDAIRTVGNSAEEDERDTCNVRFNYKYYEAFTDGYLEQVKGVLTPSEEKLLIAAPLYITYLQGLRFLTDHLNGDLYYPVRYFGHNLVRASVQFTLLKQMEDKKYLMEEVIKRVYQ